MLDLFGLIFLIFIFLLLISAFFSAYCIVHQQTVCIIERFGSWYKVVYKRISENQSIDIITFFTTQSRFFIFLN